MPGRDDLFSLQVVPRSLGVLQMPLRILRYHFIKCAHPAVHPGDLPEVLREWSASGHIEIIL